MVRPTLALLTFGAIALTAAIGLVVAMGPLNPPAGPVASTYKTLTEVEPRTAINATNTPGDASTLFKITTSGSYYLTGNITGVAGKHGITIVAGNVTINLNGYELIGPTGAGALDGILGGSNGQLNLAILNGTIRNWSGNGINLQYLSAQNFRIEGILTNANGGNGLALSNSGMVKNCSGWNNSGSGINAQNGVTITGCSMNNNHLNGIVTLSGCTIAECSAWNNFVDGVIAGSGSSVVNCTTYDNGGNGISASDGCTITGCTSRKNTLDGIRCPGQCIIRDNTCSINGTSGDGAGVHATGSQNRIEGNNCAGADRGIDVDGVGNVIIKNTCSGNTSNWEIAANNVLGPIVDATAPANVAVSGNSGAASLGSTHPNANFSY